MRSVVKEVHERRVVLGVAFGDGSMGMGLVNVAVLLEGVDGLRCYEASFAAFPAIDEDVVRRGRVEWTRTHGTKVPHGEARARFGLPADAEFAI